MCSMKKADIMSRAVPATAAAGAGAPRDETLPEWNLADLYAGMDAPEFAADLEKSMAECRSFAADYRGKLESIVRAPDAGARLFAALKRYEAIDDLLGRIGSYAGLLHAGDQSDPQRAKFYGDAHEKLTVATTELLFFTLELNRIDDKALEKAMAEPRLAH